MGGQTKVMIKQICRRKADSELGYSMVLKQMSDEEKKEYHLKRLKSLSEKSLGEIPQLEEPTYEQKNGFREK
jgi:hypothetical protein